MITKEDVVYKFDVLIDFMEDFKVNYIAGDMNDSYRIGFQRAIQFVKDFKETNIEGDSLLV